MDGNRPIRGMEDTCEPHRVPPSAVRRYPEHVKEHRSWA
jgi:hypothetical protein